MTTSIERARSWRRCPRSDLSSAPTRDEYAWLGAAHAQQAPDVARAASRFKIVPTGTMNPGDPKGCAYWIDTSTGVIRLMGLADATHATHPAPAATPGAGIWIAPGFINPLTD